MRYWQPLGAKTTATYYMPPPENERQQNVNKHWFCIIGNQGLTWIFEHKAELLTALTGTNTIHQRNNTDSKIIDIADCNLCKNKLVAVEYMILIRHNY